jgi:hypothetical protein
VHLAERSRLGDRERAEGRMSPLVLAQLLLRHYRQLRQVVQRPDVTGLGADGFDLRPIQLRRGRAALDLVAEQPLLQRPQLVTAERLDLRLEHPPRRHGQG